MTDALPAVAVPALLFRRHCTKHLSFKLKNLVLNEINFLRFLCVPLQKWIQTLNLGVKGLVKTMVDNLEENI